MSRKKGRYQTNFLGKKIKYIILLQKAAAVVQPRTSKHCLDCSQFCARVGNMNLRTLCIFLF